MKKILIPVTVLLCTVFHVFSQTQSIDNFESGALGQWNLMTGTAAASGVEVFSGSFSLEMSQSPTLLLHKTFQGGAGRYQVSFLCEGPGAGFRFLFQYQNDANYYLVSCQPQNTNSPILRLDKVVDGVGQTLSETSPSFSTGEWHELAVERQCDGEIVVLIDGVEEIAIQDASFQAAGSVGLGAAAEMVYADDLRFEAFRPKVKILGDTAFCVEPVILEASGVFAEYQWSTGSKSNQVSVEEQGVLWLEVTDQNGCKARDSVQVLSFCPTRFFAPNIFSPNFDGVNDEFRIFTKSEPQRFELHVFNRWGVLVFQSQDAGMGWDGTIQGALAPADTYLWIADLDGFTLTGSLLLMR